MKIPDDFRVEPGSKIKLKGWDPAATPGLSKDEGEALLLVHRRRLDELQYLLHAEGQRAVLVIFQAMDTGGKDGVIRDVFEGVNPVAIKVHSFKAPSAEEAAHDFLWRHHQRLPPRGEIGVHNRSHYESVLIERVRRLAPKDTWEARYEQINAWEKMVCAEGTLVLKFFLHISKEEQLERLRRRLEDPRRAWKFNPADLEERKLWDEYQGAYEDVLERCSTRWAPWHIVRADKKWYRNALVSGAIVRAMEARAPRLPAARFDPSRFKIE